MKPKAYCQHIQKLTLAAPHVIQSNLAFDTISENVCYINGSLSLINNFQLHIAEYVITEPKIKRLKYRYHLQTIEDKFIARWDNASHHPQIDTYPHHLHLAHDKIVSSPAMDIKQVLSAVLPFLM